MAKKEPQIAPETVEAFRRLFPEKFAEAEAKYQADRKRAIRNLGILIVVFLVGTTAAAYGVAQWQISLGKTAIVEFARENDLCAKPDCAEGVQIFHLAAKEAYDMDGPMLEYCMGVDSWSGLHMRRGGAFIAATRWILGMPCGSLYSESAVQPIN